MNHSFKGTDSLLLKAIKHLTYCNNHYARQVFIQEMLVGLAKVLSLNWIAVVQNDPSKDHSIPAFISIIKDGTYHNAPQKIASDFLLEQLAHASSALEQHDQNHGFSLDGVAYHSFLIGDFGESSKVFLTIKEPSNLDADLHFSIIRLYASAIKDVLVETREAECTTIDKEVNKEASTQHAIELQHAVDELDTFFYRSSHDLREPIIAIEGVYNMMIKMTEFATNPILMLLGKQIKRIKAFNKSIIEVGEIRSRKKEIVPIHLKALCEKICDQLGASKVLDVRMNIDGQDSIQSDQFLVEGIIAAVVQNSIDFRDPAKEESWMEVFSLQKEHGVTLVIADNGIGINKDLAKNLFSMFFRATSQSGLGLGLYKTRMATNRIHGEIEIKSLEFEGTNATITFPKAIF